MQSGEGITGKENWKLGAFASLSVFALAAVMTFSVNAAGKTPTTEKKFTAGSCRDKARKAGKACEHKCSDPAGKKGEVCGKCNQ